MADTALSATANARKSSVPIIKRTESNRDTQQAWDQALTEVQRLKIEATQAHELSEALASELAAKSWDLVLAPAPDLAATYWKLEYLWGDQINDPASFSDSYRIEAIAAIMADVRRFSGLEG